MADRVADRLPTDQGYAVKWGTIDFSQANGFLTSPHGSTLPLFIQEYTTDFVLTGSTAQSQLIRAFYPRNFEQPTFNFIAQAPNQAYMNRAGEFIRSFQREAISTASPGRIDVPDGGTDVRRLRGLNKGFRAEGYVMHGSRGGRFGDFAPSFQFGFTVSRMVHGLYTDQPVQIRQLKSWAEILKNLQAPGSGTTFVINPDLPFDVTQNITDIATALGALGK